MKMRKNYRRKFANGGQRRSECRREKKIRPASESRRESEAVAAESGGAGSVSGRLKIGSVIYQVLAASETGVTVRRRLPVWKKGVKSYEAMVLGFERIERLGGIFVADGENASATSGAPSGESSGDSPTRV